MNKIDTQWQKAQEQIFVKWINETIPEKQITHLEKDLSDGTVLIRLSEELKQKKFPMKYIEKPQFKIQKISNCSLALQFIEEEFMIKTSCSPENIVNGGEDIKFLYGLLFQMYLKCHKTTLVSTQLSQNQQYELLLNWLNETLYNYEIPLENQRQLMENFYNGKILVGLLDCFFDQEYQFYEYMMKKHEGERIGLSMRIARDLLGVTELLTTEDVLSHQIDPRVFFFYFDFIINAFNKKATVSSINLIQLVEEAIKQMNDQMKKEQLQNETDQQKQVRKEQEEHIHTNDYKKIHKHQNINQNEKKMKQNEIDEFKRPIVLKDVLYKGRVNTKKVSLQRKPPSDEIFHEPEEEYMKPIPKNERKYNQSSHHEITTTSTYRSNQYPYQYSKQQTKTTTHITQHETQQKQTVVTYSFWFI